MGTRGAAEVLFALSLKQGSGTATLDRPFHAECKNGFRVLADEPKIGRTGAKYIIIFGAPPTETSAPLLGCLCPF